MADHGYSQADDTPRQAAGATSATSTGRTEDRSGTSADRGDRERSIATGRESTRAPGASRRPTGAPLYGGGFGPFSLIRRMTEDMDRMLGSLAFGRGLGTPLATNADRDLWSDAAANAAWIPEVETFRQGDKLIVRADLPGLSKDDVTVEVNDGRLTISGERCDEREENRDNFYRSERSYGQFSRAIPLPEGVSADQVDATFKNGVLEVAVPLPKQEKKARQVQVR
jgi:HSP20 family protein